MFRFRSFQCREEPDDAEVEASSFPIAMLGMVEVERFGHGSKDGDVGWRAAVLGVVLVADGGEAVSEQGVQLSGVRARHSRIWAAQLDDRLAHRSERTRDCLSADSLVMIHLCLKKLTVKEKCKNGQNWASQMLTTEFGHI